MADDRRIEAALLRRIALGDPASRTVYNDWLEEHGEAPPDRPSVSGADGVGGIDAMPVAHDEVYNGVFLYERVTQLAGHIRHNPTGTTWVFAYRGLWKSIPVMLFRAGPWLQRPGSYTNNAILADVGDLAIATFTSDRSYGAALIEAPAGIRLRALALGLIARSEPFPLPIACDIAVASAGKTGDTFVCWDGSLWFSPPFEDCYESEMPSADLTEVYDPIVADSAGRLHDLLCPLPELINNTYVRDHTVLPEAQRSSALAALLEDEAQFLARCRERAQPSAPWLADQLRRLFPAAYAAQRDALASVGIDIDQPWQPRRT